MFDTTIKTISGEIVFSDQIELYRKRRMDAIALWQSIPADHFNMLHWEKCALGVLANETHDEWDYICGLPGLRTHPQHSPATAAAIYFAITINQAVKCFGTHYESWDIPLSKITAKNVEDFLMRCDYTIQPENGPLHV